jgi:hypothetical protein
MEVFDERVHSPTGRQVVAITRLTQPGKPAIPTVITIAESDRAGRFSRPTDRSLAGKYLVVSKHEGPPMPFDTSGVRKWKSKSAETMIIACDDKGNDRTHEESSRKRWFFELRGALRCAPWRESVHYSLDGVCGLLLPHFGVFFLLQLCPAATPRIAPEELRGC